MYYQGYATPRLDTYLGRFRAGVEMSIDDNVLPLALQLIIHDQPSNESTPIQSMAMEWAQHATEGLQEAGRKRCPPMLPFTPNESWLETLASLHIIAATGTLWRCQCHCVRPSAPFVGFPVVQSLMSTTALPMSITWVFTAETGQSSAVTSTNAIRHQVINSSKTVGVCNRTNTVIIPR